MSRRAPRRKPRHLCRFHGCRRAAEVRLSSKYLKGPLDVCGPCAALFRTLAERVRCAAFVRCEPLAPKEKAG